MEEAKNLEADLDLDQDLRGQAMAVTHRGHRDQAMEVGGHVLREDPRDGLRDDLRDDPVLTMEAKEVRCRVEVVGRSLDLQVFSTCFLLLTLLPRHHRLVK